MHSSEKAWGVFDTAERTPWLLAGSRGSPTAMRQAFGKEYENPKLEFTYFVPNSVPVSSLARSSCGALVSHQRAASGRYGWASFASSCLMFAGSKNFIDSMFWISSSFNLPLYE